MSSNVVPFNPLDKKNLGASVADALLASKVHSLARLTEFYGAGIYAIYYIGDFPAYQQIAKRNQNNQFSIPMYVGKAVPAGARKGINTTAGANSRVLWSRLKEHADSINIAENLSLDDFYCRYLVVDDIWIPLGESLVINHFSPIWNTYVDGFGNHDPGKGRYAGMLPRWDVLHPGRKWALKCAPRTESQEDIIREVIHEISNYTFPATDKLVISPD
jgi:Eco29kI restriction endonuclease